MRKNSFIKKLPDKKANGVYSFASMDKLFELSFYFDNSGVQNSFCFRSLEISRIVADFLIEKDGKISERKLRYCLEKKPYLLAPNNQNDFYFIDHLFSCLKNLLTNSKLRKLLYKFSMPLVHRQAEKIIHLTMGNIKSTITDIDVRKSVLCAFFTPLRQNVGSCFATAPAIMIQRENPELFFQDLYDLLTTSSIKRVVEGAEYTVPLSPSFGMGEMKSPISSFKDLSQSPGLLHALTEIGLIEKEGDIIEKIEKIKKLISPYLEKKNVLSIYDLVDKILTDHFSLKEQDFQAEKWAEKTEKFTSMSYHPQLYKFQKSERSEHIKEWKKAKELFFSSFRSFTDCPLLKSWEYTLASLCDVKLEFTKWNLFTSLGLDHRMPDGIGSFLYVLVENQLKKANSEIERYQMEFDRVNAQMKTLEASLYRTQNFSEENRMRREIQSFINEMETILSLREKAETKAQAYANVYSHLIEQFILLLEEHFREIYDAQMLGVSSGYFDDSPAGFRLMYTHGRKDPSLWTIIENEDGFIKHLRDFFISIESNVIASFPDLTEDITYFLTEVIQFIQTSRFLPTVYKRIAVLQSKQFTEIAKEKIEDKPWAYISGGTMKTLLTTYFRQDIACIEKETKSCHDLIFFLIKMLREAPQEIQQALLNNPKKAFLLYSPSHACLFYPGFFLFKDSWQTKLSIDQWIEKKCLFPFEEFIAKISLDTASQQCLLEEFLKEFPENFRYQVHSRFFPANTKASVAEFSYRLFSCIAGNLPLLEQKKVQDKIASFIYQAIPTFSKQEVLAIIPSILQELKIEDNSLKEEIIAEIADANFSNVTSSCFQELIKDAIFQVTDQTCFAVDFHREILKAFAKLKLCYPRPIIFADSNWACYNLGFIINPTTLILEIWRFDFIEKKGIPMTEWSLWDKGALEKWGVYLDLLGVR